MENQTLRQKQKQEALERMKLLQIMPQVRNDFKNNDRLYYSERLNAIFNATLYWVDNKPEFVNLIKEFENKYNALVYHAQLTHLEFGDCLALLYVSNQEEEWSQDKRDILEGYAFSFVKNLSDEMFDDFGTIGIKPSMGGVVRTA